MKSNLPHINDVRAAMQKYNLADLELLSQASGVPFTTLYKIKRGETEDPGYMKVRQFIVHLDGKK